MATCKDCIHYEVCNIHGYIDADECAVFKNKADFVEVVHCEKCKYCDHCYPAKAIDEEAIVGWYCNLNSKYVLPTHYCGYGERRDK